MTNASTEKLTNYAGQVVSAELHVPETEDDLRRVLANARSERRRLTFRAGGMSFDSQCLGDDLVVSMERFDRIEVDETGATVTAGAGAKWKDILARTSERGLLPYVIVTTGEATAGGTLSSHSISRFTPTLGREGRYVSRLRLMLPDGSVETCSRSENPELFGAAIGGLGYFGAILEVTHRLFCAPVSGSDIAVETVFEKLSGVDELVRRIVPEQDELDESAPSERVWEDARALSAVVYLRGGRRCLFATSRYVDRRSVSAPRSVFHSPRSFGHLSLQFMVQLGPLRNFAYRSIFGPGFREPSRHLDELSDYTFFQDGNLTFRRYGRRARFRMGIRHQTYFLPYDPASPAASTLLLERFFDEAEREIQAHGLLPALIDVLYIPADDGFLLSASRRLPSLSVTITFERLTTTNLEPEGRICKNLSSACAAMGGRVHLVKQVHAKAGVVQQMYAGVLDEVRELRKRLGAQGLLENEFFERTLGR